MQTNTEVCKLFAQLAQLQPLSRSKIKKKKRKRDNKACHTYHTQHLGLQHHKWRLPTETILEACVPMGAWFDVRTVGCLEPCKHDAPSIPYPCVFATDWIGLEPRLTRAVARLWALETKKRLAAIADTELPIQVYGCTQHRTGNNKSMRTLIFLNVHADMVRRLLLHDQILYPAFQTICERLQKKFLLNNRLYLLNERVPTINHGGLSLVFYPGIDILTIKRSGPGTPVPLRVIKTAFYHTSIQPIGLLFADTALFVKLERPSLPSLILAGVRHKIPFDRIKKVFVKWMKEPNPQETNSSGSPVLLPPPPPPTWLPNLKHFSALTDNETHTGDWVTLLRKVVVAHLKSQKNKMRQYALSSSPEVVPCLLRYTNRASNNLVFLVQQEVTKPSSDPFTLAFVTLERPPPRFRPERHALVRVPFIGVCSVGQLQARATVPPPLILIPHMLGAKLVPFCRFLQGLLGAEEADIAHMDRVVALVVESRLARRRGTKACATAHASDSAPRLPFRTL